MHAESRGHEYVHSHSGRGVLYPKVEMFSSDKDKKEKDSEENEKENRAENDTSMDNEEEQDCDINREPEEGKAAAKYFDAEIAIGWNTKEGNSKETEYMEG